MNAISPLTLLLLFIALIGYTILCVWFLYRNEIVLANKVKWSFLIVSFPFLGPTFYLFYYFTEQEFR